MYSHTEWPKCHTQRCLPEKPESSMGIHSSFICRWPQTKTTQMTSTNTQIKMTICTHQGNDQHLKKNWRTDTNTEAEMYEYHNNSTKWKKLDWENLDVLYYSIHINCMSHTWRFTLSVLALVSQRQEELWKVEARLVCVVSPRAVRTI